MGLGERNSTPVGIFTVRAGSKLINPAWTNPWTGQHFDRDDPNIPIGERWIGLRGIDEATRVALADFLQKELGTSDLGAAATYLEEPLRTTLHLILSLPEYQLG